MRITETAKGRNPYSFPFIPDSIALKDMTIDWVTSHIRPMQTVFNSNQVARSIASGKWNKAPGQLAVTVASSDYVGTADYYCDGTADDVEINAAMVYLGGIGGGQLQLTDGTYNTTAAVDQSHFNIIVQGMQNTIIKKNCNDYAWKIVGISSTQTIVGGKIQNIQFTRDSADTNPWALLFAVFADYISITGCVFQNAYNLALKAQYCRGINVSSNQFLNSGNAGVDIENSTLTPMSVNNNYCSGNLYGIGINSSSYVTVSDNFSDGDGYGIYVIGDYNSIKANRVLNATHHGIHIASGLFNQIESNACQWNGKNLIDRPDCESATPPATYGELSNTLTNATFVQSAAKFHAGANSYLFTKTIAAGTAASAYLTDNVTTTDTHGMFAGHQYTFDPWVYIPGGGMTGTNITIVIDQYYAAAWHATTQACANTYDAWQQPTVTATLDASCTGFRVGFLVAAAEAINTIFYADDVELFDTNPVTNVYNRNFYDAGTNTQVG